MKALTRITTAALAIATTTLLPVSTKAADHGDAPALAQDLGADIADVFAFLDPNDNDEVVLIATIHGFLVPGEVSNFAVFDENIRYRFEIYNDHVNDTSSPFFTAGATKAQKAAFLARVKPARTIDVTFSKREVGPNPQSNTANGNPIPLNLRRPLPQEVTVTLGGFEGVRDKGFYPGALVSPFGVGATATPLQVYQIANIKGSESIRVFAGLVDDPFFFDVPAFTAFVDSFRNGNPSTAAFSRARDTFAGYNVLAIALRIPKDLLVNSDSSKPVIGVDFLAQRHATEMTTNDGQKGVGAFKTVDRMGNPTVNVALIPFDTKNAYNAASVKDDVSLKFAGTITETLNEFGLVSSPTPEASYLALANTAVVHGDLLQLNTSIANTGTNPTAAFPNGRRVIDDTVDTVLTLLNHGNTLTDNIPAGDSAIPTTFPFLALPHQPRFDTNVDDGTRN